MTVAIVLHHNVGSGGECICRYECCNNSDCDGECVVCLTNNECMCVGEAIFAMKIMNVCHSAIVLRHTLATTMVNVFAPTNAAGTMIVALAGNVRTMRAPVTLNAATITIATKERFARIVHARP